MQRGSVAGRELSHVNNLKQRNCAWGGVEFTLAWWEKADQVIAAGAIADPPACCHDGRGGASLNGYYSNGIDQSIGQSHGLARICQGAKRRRHGLERQR